MKRNGGYLILTSSVPTVIALLILFFVSNFNPQFFLFILVQLDKANGALNLYFETVKFAQQGTLSLPENSDIPSEKETFIGKRTRKAKSIFSPPSKKIVFTSSANKKVNIPKVSFPVSPKGLSIISDMVGKDSIVMFLKFMLQRL